jgi:lipopolysaccharide transport system ATP-binding protein
MQTIQVENLGKQYRIGRAQPARYLTLRDELARLLKLGRRPPSPTPARARGGEAFWALSEVSFSVREGERVGIIGRNGAGKSTLLKILSRITDPTTGSARVRGRVSSLLEVGTGFHPELSGRENIYLNGAILGMTAGEIARKLDEIVAFAEVERFLDAPVKHYSSGMYVRLAFSIAAHLEPDVLIVDEVLAVGDAHFQKKCLGKMQEAERTGRTILFVSHNMATITSLCSRCLLLSRGRLVRDDLPSRVVLEYYGSTPDLSPAFNDFAGSEVGDGQARLISAAVCNTDGEIAPEILITQPFKVCMRYRLLEDVDGQPVPNFHFLTAEGAYAFVSAPGNVVRGARAGEYQAECHVPANFLNEGAYAVSVALTSYFHDAPIRSNFYERHALSFNVRDPMDETVSRYGWSGPIPGVIRPQLDWAVRPVGPDR